MVEEFAIPDNLVPTAALILGYAADDAALEQAPGYLY
jgi:hypothetical protein